MSFECNTCHTVATGKTHEERFHFFQSYGRCETCGKTASCADCHCSGDWGKAYRQAQSEKVSNSGTETN